MANDHLQALVELREKMNEIAESMELIDIYSSGQYHPEIGSFHSSHGNLPPHHDEEEEESVDESSDTSVNPPLTNSHTNS